ncbi:MAG: hypothetical protein QOG04_1462 [Actinomycetota bacterium]|nr:hypothetical protein [Actinomycetota bacterium]
MTKRFFALLVMGMLVFSACGANDGETEGEGTAARGECSGEVPGAADIPGLPENFPIPGEAVLNASSEAGPSQIIEGYFEADIENAFPEYKEAFESAGYDITKDEQEEDDAEIFFAGDGTTGQVNMFAECDGRTKLRITIRPD